MEIFRDAFASKVIHVEMYSKVKHQELMQKYNAQLLPTESYAQRNMRVLVI